MGSSNMAVHQCLALLLLLSLHTAHQRDIPQGLSDILKSLDSFPEKVSPFLIPGTEVSERLNGGHGFVVDKVDTEHLDNERKNMKKDIPEKLESASTSLVIEPHPEEYLAEMSRNSRILVKLNNHYEEENTEAGGKEGEEEKKEEGAGIFFSFDPSGSYSVTW